MSTTEKPCGLTLISAPFAHPPLRLERLPEQVQLGQKAPRRGGGERSTRGLRSASVQAQMAKAQNSHVVFDT
jgi:hypothetical protein